MLRPFSLASLAVFSLAAALVTAACPETNTDPNGNDDAGIVADAGETGEEAICNVCPDADTQALCETHLASCPAEDDPAHEACHADALSHCDAEDTHTHEDPCEACTDVDQRNACVEHVGTCTDPEGTPEHEACHEEAAALCGATAEHQH